MIALFDVHEKKVVPAAAVYAIPWLKRIMDLFPDEYIEIYAYIFFLTCPDKSMNPYRNHPEALRESIILSDLKPTFYLEDLVIEDTIRRCKEMYETTTLRSYIAAKKGVEKISAYLDETEITDGKEGNGMLYDKYMSKIADYNKQYKDLEKELEEEQAKVRGGASVPYWQRPGYEDRKKEEDDE